MFPRYRFLVLLPDLLWRPVLAVFTCGSSGAPMATSGAASAVFGTPLSPPSPNVQYTASVKWDDLLIPDSRYSNNQYSVEVKIKNNGGTLLVFDYSEGAFFGTNMKGLSTRVYSLGPSPAEGTKTKVTEIKTGEEQVCNFATDTYTDELLRNSGQGPLYFKVVLYREDKEIDWSGIAILPRLEELKADQQSHSLTFYR